MLPNLDKSKKLHKSGVEYAYRVLKAKWKSQTLKEFSVGVEFTGIDGMGILNSLTNLVTGSLNINIKSLNIGSEAGFLMET